MPRIKGTPLGEDLMGGAMPDTIAGGDGDDFITGGDGNDRLRGERGFDVLRGEAGDDHLKGGRDADFLFGGDGNDTLMGDTGWRQTFRGADTAGDRLDGGAGDDLLVLADGLETATGGTGADTFLFKQTNPLVTLAAGTGAAFTAITDFDAATDTLAFDAAGVGRDSLAANFRDGSEMGGGITASFYSGGAAGAAGQNVVVLTEIGFASGLLAVQAVAGEVAGDLILYFNTTVGAASLLNVSAPDTVNSIARLTNITSVTALADEGFTASDFVFV